MAKTDTSALQQLSSDLLQLSNDAGDIARQASRLRLDLDGQIIKLQHRNSRWTRRLGRARSLLTGYSPYSPVPFWRQTLHIPTRPLRWLRRRRHIAQIQREPYSPAEYDSVP